MFFIKHKYRSAPLLDIGFNRKGSAVMIVAITAAIITGFIGLVLTKMWNVNFNALNVTTDRSQAMQYVLNSADVTRATRYINLVSSPRAEVSGTDFEREIIVTQDPNLVDTKQAVIRVYKNDSDIPIASMVVKKSRVSEVLYDSIGDNTDGAMTQKSATEYFALKDSVLTKDETYNIFLTQARANALLQALEDSVADNYLTKVQAQNIYRKIVDSYTKGETDSLLNELKNLVNVNKANIATNSSNISTNSTNINANKSNISGLDTRLKTVEDALSLYLKINDAADLYLTKAVAASTYAVKSTAVTHTANTAVGSSTRPVYIASNGVATALSGTVGSASEPIYLNNGVFTKITGGSSSVAVTAGTVKTGNAIPIPSGYTRDQCHYAVWPLKVYEVVDGADYYELSVDQSTGVVRVYTNGWGYTDTCGYLCIAVK